MTTHDTVICGLYVVLRGACALILREIGPKKLIGIWLRFLRQV